MVAAATLVVVAMAACVGFAVLDDTADVDVEGTAEADEEEV